MRLFGRNGRKMAEEVADAVRADPTHFADAVIAVLASSATLREDVANLFAPSRPRQPQPEQEQA